MSLRLSLAALLAVYAGALAVEALRVSLRAREIRLLTVPTETPVWAAITS